MPSPATVYSENLYPMESQHLMGGSGSQQGPFVEFVPAHPKGIIRFRPFDNGLDATARESIKKFQIYPAGHIEDFCRHIPYASGKKDFFEKTGRESFEVFQYVFKVPGDDKEYHVMWDYNIGLVRMTPFFKCCKYSKTTPAKMLNLNPGLRDITHSITGGSIMAQGYWMPFTCAKAVCATFCYHIAGALIPIFGPDFPSECLPPQSTDFARMVIDQALVIEATRETHIMREIYLRNPDEGVMPPVGTSEDARSVAKRPRWEPQMTSMSAPVSRPVSRRWETTGTNFHTGRPVPTPSHRSERRNSIAGDEHQSSQQTHLEPSYCYPSPPRRLYAELYYAEADPNRPPPLTESVVKDEEAYVMGLPSGKTATSDGAEDAAVQQTQPRTTTRRRRIKVRGSGLGSSSSSWNVKDVDAAEVLVNFSVKVKSSKGKDQECDSDTEGSKTAKPRFNGSIASLLCDDEVPRRKRRKS
ncbi:hypothetical protein SBRCBS47491_009211 [Sporothrix bragantina]|uniref:HTH APSES-type domain-containing protein n=1 Tax=Sporothrix bragantina TaxID=671064 RepID=A0ABP0CUE7_9PEZI